MNNWLRFLSKDDLPEPYFSIAQRFGVDVALEVNNMFQGSQIYFPRLENACNEKRKEWILNEFDGYNFQELASKYECTERWVRMICRDDMIKQKNKPLDGQISFDEL